MASNVVNIKIFYVSSYASPKCVLALSYSIAIVVFLLYSAFEHGITECACLKVLVYATLMNVYGFIES